MEFISFKFSFSIRNATEFQQFEYKALLEQLRSLLHPLNNAALEGIEPRIDLAFLQLQDNRGLNMNKLSLVDLPR